MTGEQYTKEKLFELGKDNYEKLVSYCEILEINGFWDQARQVMKKTSTQVLDLYVQSVLMNLAVHCGEVLENQKDFIRLVTKTNPLSVPQEGEIEEKTISESKQYYELPPVLLQLCGLYDKEKKEIMTEQFLDAFLNILLCMAYLNNGKNREVNEFIQKYYDKISNFILNRDEKLHSEYIVRKLTSNVIRCDVEWVREKQKDIEKQKIAKIKELQKKKEAAKKKNDAKERKKDNNTLITKNDTERKTVIKKISKTDFKKNIKKSDDTKKCVITNDGDVFTDLEADKIKIMQQQEEQRIAREEFMKVKRRILERERVQKEEQEKRIKVLVDELNGMIGLSEVKEEIQSLINLIKIRNLREEMNMPVMDMSYHMVFTGSPGTGKTTVARLVGKIYKELGILSDGKMVETDRSGLVAGYVGQTAMKVHDVVEEAMGGVLFIDEAYSLVNNDMPNDFGTEAVDALVKLMEDHRDNLVIIVAGYTDEMKTFLKSNTGLVSRFNKFINFPDYTKDELVNILSVMANKAGLKIDEAAKSKVLELLKKMKPSQWKDFGNARGMRNLFEKFVMNQANRLVKLENPTRDDLMTIKEDDVFDR
ncbi:AAA family ATPase [Butyribacter sp.]|uniref:AAA family ATPase n=1 Tax=Butyribacter sp. TaxID=2822465 RepID=UPI002A9B07EA|nr:AAA family ATPase [Butyribacter sp.]